MGFFAPLLRGRTYLRMAYMLLGLPLGIVYFTFLVTAVSVGVGLVVIWVGVLILVATVIGWRAMGGFERRLTTGMLGGEIDAPPPLEPKTQSLWGRTRALLADSYTYRSFFWLLLRFPMGIAGFVVTVTGVAVALGLIFGPVAFFADPGDLQIAPEILEGLEWLALVSPIVGVMVLGLTAHVINGFADVHVLAARSLLGPGARQEVQVQRRRAQAAEERTRLAHELHDSVGHTLTMMVVQAGAGGHVYEKDPEFARKALAQIEESGRQALGELDRILGILREDDAGERSPQPGLAGLPGLVADLQDAGLPVTLSVEGTVDDLPTDVSRSGYRIVQEALTNVMKHAGTVPTTVAVHRGAGVVEIEVLDGGPDGEHRGTGFAPAESGGRGLVGIEERVALLGGSVEAGPRPGGGFRLWARIPAGGGRG